MNGLVFLLDSSISFGYPSLLANWVEELNKRIHADVCVEQRLEPLKAYC